MSSAPGCVALVASRALPTAAPLHAARLAGLVARGWDAHLVLDEQAALSFGLSQLPDPALRRRVHLWPAHPPTGVARTAIPRRVVRQLVRNPRGASRFIRGGGRPTSRLLRGRQVESVLIALRPELVHFDSPAVAIDQLRTRHLVVFRSVVTVAEEDLGPPGLDPPDSQRRVWAEADAVEVEGEAVLRRVLSQGFPTSRPAFSWGVPAADPRFFDPGSRDGHLDRQPRALRIVSVSELSWINGYEWALQAIKLLVESGRPCEYRIVGRGEHLEALSFARYQLGLEGEVELVPDELRAGQLKDHLAWADVYLDSAVAAGSSNAARAAQAMALPVVATDRTAGLSGLQPRLDCAVVPRRDPEAMAQELSLLAADPSLRHQMGLAGRQHVLERWRLDDHVAELEAAYRSLLAV